MKLILTRISWWLFTTFAAAAVVFAAAGGNQASDEDEKTAQKFIEGVCSTCHDSTLIKETQATKDEWLDIVKNMNGKGAGLSERDVELLAEYLAKNYGPKK